VRVSVPKTGKRVVCRPWKETVVTRVEGTRKSHNVRVYALSTCMWCKKTKKLLEESSVEYEFEDVDLLQGAEREEMVAELKKHNPGMSFPTILVDDTVLVGYRENELKEALGL
jgi:glutaredoxin-like protein NrdH